MKRWITALIFTISYGNICLGISNPNRSITIIFKNNPNIEQYFYHTKTMWIKQENVIEIYDGDVLTTIDYIPGKAIQPLTKPLDNEYAVFRVRRNFFDFEEYLVEKGDSILLGYNKDDIEINILNRDTKKYDLLFEKLPKDKNLNDQFTSIGSYLNSDHLNARSILSNKKAMDDSKGMSILQKMERNKIQVNNIKHQLYPAVKFSVSRQIEILDSLKSNNELSKGSYDYYLSRARCLNYIFDLETDRLGKDEILKIFISKEFNLIQSSNLYYKKFVNSVEEKYIVSDASFVDLRDGVNRDYREIFFLIRDSNLFTRREKDYLLTKELNRIHSSFSLDDFKKYFSIYQEEVKDSSMLARTNDNFSIEFDSSRNKTNSVALIKISGSKFMLEDVLLQHAGKVIYVDFWASWCAPCREALMASHDLRKAMAGADVVFIYLSIDNNKTAWLTASSKEKLSEYSENYLIVNHKSSEFLKKNKLNEIPRYMIFDKSGTLIYANAPRVESSEIGLLLTRLASKP